MAFDLEKLTQMAKPRSEEAKERAKKRKENRAWIRMSQEIAICLHYYLRSAGLNQKQLADKMGVSAVYVGKLLKGGENLTLETICKIQGAIGKTLVSTAKPYIFHSTVSFSSMTRFSEDAVESERYRDLKTYKSAYVLSTGDAA